MAVSVLFASISNQRTQSRGALERLELSQMEGLKMQERLAKTEGDVAAQASLIKKLIEADTIGSHVSKGTNAAVALRAADRKTLDSVLSGQSQLSIRMAALEASLLNTPDKALAVPLLKQQMVDNQDRFRSDLDSVHAEFGRLYNMVQWALGLIVTIILGLASSFLVDLKARTKAASGSVASRSAPSESSRTS